MVYSSYLGRQWHQLWVVPANGGDAFPISYGDWDDTNVRWSPDGKQVAFISNKNGNTELRLQTIPGGANRELEVDYRKYLRPRATIRIGIRDGEQPALARISVVDETGKFYAPNDAWIHADDGFNRAERPFEAHYFYPHERYGADVQVPEGKVFVEIMKGFEKHIEKQTVMVKEGEDTRVVFSLKSLQFQPTKTGQWVGADLHVHMNYGGEYRNDEFYLPDQADSEGLAIVNNLIVNKEQRFPDIAFDKPQLNTITSRDGMIVKGQEFHTSYWGHRGLLNIKKHMLLPGYAGYPNTAAASLYPMNADVYDMARAEGAIIGAVHPFDEIPDPLANPPQRITDELPVDVALGKIDYMEIVGFSDHRSTATVWYRLLNLGYRIPAGAGTDAMANYSSLRGPVGMNRVYAWVPEWPLDAETWFAALKKGRTFATNGPLLEFTLEEQRVGEELQFDKPQEAVAFTAKMRSIVPVDHLEVVCNGRVVQTVKLDGERNSADAKGTLPLHESGWCLLRASSDEAEYPVLDNYVYATTSPIYATIRGKKPRSPEDAKYFVAWIERVMDATSHYPDWNSAEEKVYVMKKLQEGKSIFEKMQ
jgi:hypothetical protein